MQPERWRMLDMDDGRKRTVRDRMRRRFAERPGKPLEMARLGVALRRRKRWIFVALAVGLAASLAIPKAFISHEYTATAVVEWEPREGDEGMGAVRDLRTLVDSVKLPTSLEKVRKRLAIETTLDKLGERLEVTFDRESNVVSVAAKAYAPEAAAELANETVQVFLQHHVALEQTRREEQVASIREQLDRSRRALAEARNEYDRFRERHGISDLSLERQHAIELTAKLRAEAELAQAEAHTQDARAETLEARARSAPRRRIASRDLREARRELESLQTRLSERHPRVRALAARVGQLEADQPVSSGPVGSARLRKARTHREAAEKRHDTYARLMEESNARLEQLSAVEGKASSLLSTVRVEERHVAQRESDLAAAEDALQAAPKSLRVIAPALAPEEPSDSRRRPAAVAILMGVLSLAIGAILFLEVRGLRVHAPGEVAFWGNGAVLGASTYPRATKPIEPLIEELGDFALEQGGVTLVIGLHAEGSRIAADVAERLSASTAFAVDLAAVSASDAADVVEEPGAQSRGAVADEPFEVDVPVEVEEPVEVDVPVEVEPPVEPDERKAPVPESPRARHDPHEGVLVTPPTGPGAIDEDVPGEAMVVHGTQPHRARLARAPTQELTGYRPPRFAACRAESMGPPVRRAARLADRVIVVVPAGRIAFRRLDAVRQELGRDDDGVAFLLVGLRPDLARLPDRVGPVEAFWCSRTLSSHTVHTVA